jgi:hypothetical protein
VTRLRTGRQRRRSSGQEISVFSEKSKSNLGPTKPGAVFPGVMGVEHEADHSNPSSSEVKSGGAIPLLPHTFSCLGD